MQLSHATALSLVLHLATVLALSLGPIYTDSNIPSRDESVRSAFSVSIPARLTALTNSESSIPVNPSSDTPRHEYFSPSEVDQRAEPVYVKPLIIPERAYLERRKGKAKLRAYIDEAGNVSRVVILSAEPTGVFEQAAIDAVTSTVFTPARNDGLPVKTFKDLEIDIDPYESINVP